MFFSILTLVPQAMDQLLSIRPAIQRVQRERADNEFIIACGDMNIWAAGGEFPRLKALMNECGLHDLWESDESSRPHTFSCAGGHTPYGSLDYIFVDQRLVAHVRSKGLHDASLFSDHMGVVTELDLRAAAAAASATASATSSATASATAASDAAPAVAATLAPAAPGE